MSGLYKRLDKAERQIRLLRVREPAIPGEALHCETRIPSLLPEHVDKYTAISYCWSSTEVKKTLMIDGQSLSVDAICINQEDLEERTHQVSMMRDVYSKADHVFVWLGEEDGTTALAISSIHAIVAQCKEETQGFAKLNDIIWADKAYTYSDAGLPSVCNWKALYSFFSCPWFTRLWPIQEVCLAKEAICHRGQHNILWSKIALAARWIYHRKYWTIGNQICRGLDCAAEVYDSSGGPKGLYEHLQLCPYFDATDPRDKIFGLLGLIPPSSPGAEGQSLAIVPDYQRMSLKDVYAAAARVAIAEGSFVVLKRATFLLPPLLDIPYPNTLLIGSFPSWVPRLDGSWDARRGSPMPIIARAGKYAGGDFRQRPVPSPDDVDVLLLRGLIVTKVARTSKPLSYELLDDPAEAANVIRHAWAMATEQISASYDAREALTMFISTLSAGRNANGQMIYGNLAHEQRFAVRLGRQVNVRGSK